MATLIGNSKYGNDHKIILKSKLSSVVGQKFKQNGYVVGESVFSLVSQHKIHSINIELGEGDKSILLKDDKNIIVRLIGSASSINGTFNHYSANAKSNTKVLTEVKETISLLIFEDVIERKKLLTEDEVRNKLSNSYISYYDSSYYESAIKQVEALKKYNISGGYTYELQGANLTKKLYIQARKLSGLSNDNWNPADVWMIRKGFKNINKDFNNLEELNSFIGLCYENRDIIPISLKHISGERAITEIVSPTSTRELKIDMRREKVDLSDTFNNFIIQTKSRFAARVGFKASSSTLNVSIEGRMLGTGYQMGAVDAKHYKKYCKDNYKYDLRGGTTVNKTDIEKAKRELKSIINTFGRISNTIKNYDHAISLLDEGNELTKFRFANIISYLYSFTIIPKNEFEEHMRFCYFSSKKISDKSSLYLLIK